MGPSQIYTIQQIDGIKGIRTPHERDLFDMGKKHVDSFKNLTNEDLSVLTEVLGASRESLDFGEMWSLTKEYFPDVKIHMMLQFDEEGLGGELYELQFLFSGERITWVSGEDLCHLVEILLNYSVSVITGELPQDIYTGIPSPLVFKALKERTINWNEVPMDKELHSYFVFTPFPGLTFEYDIASTPTSFKIKTEKLQTFWIYDIDRLIIMGLNQILRLVKIRMNKNAPIICDAMFSGLYKKCNPDKFP